MTSLAKKTSLKEINALKKRLTWGDIPDIYHLVSSSLSELDGILTHGFDSNFKKILDKSTWNLQALGGTRSSDGKIHVSVKPQIILQHEYNELGYELQCYPVIDGEKIIRPLIRELKSPFQTWLPESMRILFRINNLVAFAIFTYQRGDEADLTLLKYAFYRVEKLITILSESFQILEVEGFSIAEFYKEIAQRDGNILTGDTTQTSSAN